MRRLDVVFVVLLAIVAAMFVAFAFSDHSECRAMGGRMLRGVGITQWRCYEEASLKVLTPEAAPASSGIVSKP